MAVKQLSDARTDGVQMGQSAADLAGFYGKTPIAQRASANQAAITAGATTTACNNAVIEIQATLTALGLWKGAA